MNGKRRDFTGRALALGAAGLLAGRAGHAAATGATAGATGHDTSDCPPLLSHTVRPLMGSEVRPLCEGFSGRVLLMVNTASQCAFTPQFESLETLNRRYAERGLAVLGFPSDDFRQELDDEAGIAEFCELNYGVSFPMFEKMHVSGSNANPLFLDLAADGRGFPDWNFNKYLVDREGRVRARYGASALPLGERLVADIEALL